MSTVYRLLSFVGILLAGVCFSAPAPKAGYRPLCYVSPNGNNQWSGNLPIPNAAKTDGPFATIPTAQAKVRAVLASGVVGPITVVVKGGTYYLTEPLVFTAQGSGTAESPVTYAAAPGEKPVFSGGTPISGWKKGEGNVWMCDIPAVKSGTWYFHQLFINGQRAVRARTPNDGFLYMDGTVKPLKTLDWAKLGPETKDGLRFKPGEMKNWRELDDVNVVVYHSWTSSRHWVRELDVQDNVVRFKAPSAWPIGYWDKQGRYFVENFKEALDSPGEWYLSRAEGRLYYWPRSGENMTRAQVVAPRLQHLVEMKGDAALGLTVDHLILRGLSFQHAEWLQDPTKICDGQASVHLSAAVVGEGIRDCVFDHCEIAHVGEYAMILGDGCQGNKVVHCEIHDIGGGGVRLGTTELPKYPAQQASHNTVDNCLIYDGGHVFEAGIGVWIGRSSYNTVSHNEICDFMYSGCSVGWSWGYAPSTANHNIFEYNHIHHIGQGMLNDLGGIYSLGISPGTVERYNRIHDVYSYNFGGWGLYADEGSSDIVLENNVVYNTKSGGIHQHYGQRNVFRNNILGHSMEADIISQRTDIGNDLTFEHNIVSVDNGTPLGGNLTPDRFTLCNNLYWDEKGNDLDFYGNTFAEWQAKGKDQGSLVANPWVGPDELDCSPGGPLAKIGFKPFDMSMCGLYGEPEWVDKPKSFVYPEVKLQPPSGPLLVNDNFEATAVGEKPNAQGVNEEDPATIRICDEAAATGKHSVKFTDAPGLKYEWQPHLVYNPYLKSGMVHFGFSARLEQGAILWHEWRDSVSPYRVGPSLRVTAAGELIAGGKTLLHIERCQWARYEITCGLGKQSTGTWGLTVTLAGGQTQIFDALPLGNKRFKVFDWLGFVSNAMEKTVFYLDDLKMEQAEK